MLFRYPGSKSGAGIYQSIINEIPPHEVYIEAFLGSGSIMRLKRPAARGNIGIDVDASVVAAMGSAFPDLDLICVDAISYLHDRRCELGQETLVYCDPPYLFDTRKGRVYYQAEFGQAFEHRRLIEVLRDLGCMVALSGYPSSLYSELLEGWRSIEVPSMTRGGPRVEVVWFNYPQPVALHEYTYLGSDFRERERIRRKVARWTRRLSTLPVLERRCMLQALVSSGGEPGDAVPGDVGPDGDGLLAAWAGLLAGAGDDDETMGAAVVSQGLLIP
jgi:hypothetical protein